MSKSHLYLLLQDPTLCHYWFPSVWPQLGFGGLSSAQPLQNHMLQFHLVLHSVPACFPIAFRPFQLQESGQAVFVVAPMAKI